MSTYLELVNDVLLRLRETTVATVAQSPYSSLIGRFVNDAKRQVEDAYNWDSLSTSAPVAITPDATTYVVTGSGLRQKDVTVNNVTSGAQSPVMPVTIRWITDQRQLTGASPGTPVYFAWNGNNGTDCKIEVHPSPNQAYTLMVNMCVPQLPLTLDADVLRIQSEAVIMGAYARALVERGEDGGLQSSEAYGLYKGILSDQIAIEMSRDLTNDTWVAN